MAGTAVQAATVQQKVRAKTAPPLAAASDHLMAHGFSGIRDLTPHGPSGILDLGRGFASQGIFCRAFGFVLQGIFCRAFDWHGFIARSPLIWHGFIIRSPLTRGLVSQGIFCRRGMPLHGICTLGLRVCADPSGTAAARPPATIIIAATLLRTLGSLMGSPSPPAPQANTNAGTDRAARYRPRVLGSVQGGDSRQQSANRGNLGVARDLHHAKPRSETTAHQETSGADNLLRSNPDDSTTTNSENVAVGSK